MAPVTRTSTRTAREVQLGVNVSARETAPYTSFPKFNRLPLEIRLLIWEATIEPRIVRLKLDNLMESKSMLRRVRSDWGIPNRCWRESPIPRLDDYIQDQRGLYPLLGWRSDCPIPSVLLACRESFNILSKSYIRSFSSLGSLPQTYFNFELDTLYLDSWTYPKGGGWEMDQIIQAHLCSDELAKIERLAIHDDIPCEGHDYEGILCDIVAVFGNVQNLTIVQKNYKNERARQGLCREEQSAPLIFLDPVDICRRSYMFGHPEYHVNHEPKHVPEGEIFLKMIEEIFDDARDSKIERGAKPFSRPVVDHKILLTPKIKAEFEALQQAYEAVADCRCYESESVWVQYEDDEEVVV